MQGRVVDYKVTGGDPKGYRPVLKAQADGAADDAANSFRHAALFEMDDGAEPLLSHNGH